MFLLINNIYLLLLFKERVPACLFKKVGVLDISDYGNLFSKLGLGLLFIGTFLGIVYWRNHRKTKRLLWEQKLREEEQDRIRQRTAEDFHDEIGNKLTRIKLLASVAESKFTTQPDAVPKLLEQIKNNADLLYSGAKDIIWSLQPESNYLDTVVLKIRQNTASIIEYSDIQFSYQENNTLSQNRKLPGDFSRNLIMIFKEAANNILKHAHAKKVFLSISQEDKKLIISLSDDGSGLPVEKAENAQGNGVGNMIQRAIRIGGVLKITSGLNGEGTCICVEIPLP